MCMNKYGRVLYCMSVPEYLSFGSNALVNTPWS